MDPLIIIVALVAVLYFVMIRPQRAKQQALRNQLESIEPGDEVLSVGGLYGIVEEIDEEDDLIVQISDGVNVRIARRAVASVVKPEDEDDEAEDDEAEDEGGVEEDTETAEANATEPADESEALQDSR